MATKLQPSTTISIPPPVSSVTATNPKIIQNDTPQATTKLKTDFLIKTVSNDKKIEKDDLKPPPLKKPALEGRYNELLKIIGEVGKDIKPAYTNSKSHSDRLRKNISGARNVLRECLGELDRISRNELLHKAATGL